MMNLGSALAWLFTVVYLGFVTLLLVCSGPIATLTGYRAIVNRLETDDPNNPLLQGSWRLTSARQRRIVTAYLDMYGVDANVGLTLGGLAVTIPAWYFSGYFARWLMNMMPHIYL